MGLEGPEEVLALELSLRGGVQPETCPEDIAKAACRRGKTSTALPAAATAQGYSPVGAYG